MRGRTIVATEHNEQAALFSWAEVMRGKYPELARMFAIPNGSHKSPHMAKKFQAEGLKAGVPDVFLPVARGGFHGMFIEMKRRVGGRTSPEQDSWIDALRSAKYFTIVCHGWDDARWNIEQYLSLETL